MSDVHAYISPPLNLNREHCIDSPGHSALFGSYTYMDADTSLIVASALMSVCTHLSQTLFDMQSIMPNSASCYYYWWVNIVDIIGMATFIGIAGIAYKFQCTMKYARCDFEQLQISMSTLGH